jgi:hypothetical protein
MFNYDALLDETLAAQISKIITISGERIRPGHDPGLVPRCTTLIILIRFMGRIVSGKFSKSR